MRLTRTVRIAMPAASADAGADMDGAWMMHFEFEVTVSGTPDATTGYIVGIQHIDAAVRSTVPSLLRQALARGAAPQTILPQVAESLAKTLGLTVSRLSMRQHPLEATALEHAMSTHVTLTHRFDFAASHRLHCASLDAETNQRVFGKCNNPAGHGHNYRLETEVRVPLSEPPRLRAAEIERIAREQVVDRLDHRHLNTDVACFRDTNPSVEAIAKACFDWLQAPLRSAGAELLRVRLWETEKTSAIYPD